MWHGVHEGWVNIVKSLTYEKRHAFWKVQVEPNINRPILDFKKVTYKLAFPASLKSASFDFLYFFIGKHHKAKSHIITIQVIP